jgi:hypothetical protein
MLDQKEAKKAAELRELKEFNLKVISPSRNCIKYIHYFLASSR